MFEKYHCKSQIVQHYCLIFDMQHSYYKVIMYQHQVRLYTFVPILILFFCQISQAYSLPHPVQSLLPNTQVPLGDAALTEILMEKQKTPKISKLTSQIKMETVKSGSSLSSQMKQDTKQDIAEREQTTKLNSNTESNKINQNQGHSKTELVRAEIIPENDKKQINEQKDLSTVQTVQVLLDTKTSSLKTDQKLMLPSVQRRVHKQQAYSVLNIFWKQLMMEFKRFDKNQNVQIEARQTLNEQDNNDKQEAVASYSSQESEKIRKQKRKQFVSMVFIFGLLILLFVKIAKIREESNDKHYAKQQESPEEQNQRLSDHK